MPTRSAAVGMVLSVVVAIGLVAAGTAAALAAWEAPKDEIITDNQVTSYLEITREYVAALKAAGKALEGGQNSPLIAGKVVAATDERFKASLARHGMTQDEYQWVANKVWDAKAFLMLDDAFARSAQHVADQLQKNTEEQAVLKQKIATYEKALKEGRRVMTPDERTEAVKAARADQQAAEEEAKGHADIAREAGDAAAKAEADAKSALALAARPPAEVTADDRENYITGKKKDAEDAASEAKDQREKEAEEKKSLAESKAKAAAAAARAKDPDIPTTDEEKAQVKKETEDALAAAQSDLQSDADAEKLLKDASEKMQKQGAERRTSPAARNAIVLKPHTKEFDDILSAMK